MELDWRERRPTRSFVIVHPPSAAASVLDCGWRRRFLRRLYSLKLWRKALKSKNMGFRRMDNNGPRPGNAGANGGQRVNEMIRVPQVLVISEKGEQLGVMSPQEALAPARARAGGIFEMGPPAPPPPGADYWRTEV
ncbi:MAG: hypothetical protein KIG81_09765 [Thermoguttaceae bacterium]|nr:hypothetical protein [Thermoguttaceae bacterium]